MNITHNIARFLLRLPSAVKSEAAPDARAVRIPGQWMNSIIDNLGRMQSASDMIPFFLCYFHCCCFADEASILVRENTGVCQ